MFYINIRNAFSQFIWDGDIVYSLNKYRETEGTKVDITLTWANEYGQTAFKKIYDVDILNVSSGASVDSIVMEETMTYIARRISPLVRGVYSRESNGEMKGISPTSAS